MRTIIRALWGGAVGGLAGAAVLASYGVLFFLVVSLIEGTPVTWEDLLFVARLTGKFGGLLGALTGGSSALARAGRRRAAGAVRALGAAPVALLAWVTLIMSARGPADLWLGLITPWPGVGLLWSAWLVVSGIALCCRPARGSNGSNGS